jgi:hypothetical protein
MAFNDEGFPIMFHDNHLLTVVTGIAYTASNSSAATLYLTRVGVGLGAGAKIIVLIILRTHRILATIAVFPNDEIAL